MAKISRSQTPSDVSAPNTSTPAKAAGTVAAPAAPKRTSTLDTMAAQVVTAPKTQAPTSQLRFDVNPQLQEIKDYANEQGWPQQGWTHLAIPWQEIVFTTDHWKTTQSLSSMSTPSPFINGRIILPNVPPGTEVEFALHVGVSSHAPSDIGGYRERGDTWLNNNGQNYRQISG